MIEIFMGLDKNIDKILNAYFLDSANADDIKKLLEWLDESPENKRQFETLKKFWEESRLRVNVANGELAFQKIKENIKSDNSTRIRFLNPPPAKKSNFFKRYRTIAAAAVACLIIVGLLFISREFPENQLTETAEPAMLISRNESGQKSRITLPDGSVAWLNSESVLEYPEKFGNIRALKLRGEAFFDVAKDSLKPFVVKSGPVVTTALGTSFNVQSFEGDNTIRVSLLTGKVKVSLEDTHTYFLDPGYEIKYDRKSRATATNTFHAEHVIGWKDGILVFEKDSLAGALRKLERWYAVTIKTSGGPPPDFVITGKFEKNESLENVLESLRYGRSFEFTLKGKEVLINF